MTDDAARPRRRTWIGWVVGSVLVLLVIAAGWVAVRGIGATVALSQGAQTIERARALVAADEIEDLSRMAARASAHAQNAHSLTSDPVWRAAELVPWIGADLRAMRETAEIADELAGRVRGPLLDAAYEARLGPVELSGIRIDIDLLDRVAPDLERAATAFARLDARLAGIRTSGAIPPAAEAADHLRAELTALARGTAMLAGAAELLPTMLAADGARTYLLIVSGGPDAAPTAAVIGVADGAFSLQAAGRAVDPLADAPFPEAALTAAQAWAAAHRTTIDGVVAVDAELLPDLAEAVGLTEEAGTGLGPIFQRIAEGGVDPASLWSVVVAAGDRDGIRVWSAHEDEQRRLEQTTLAG
ncbi:hypothetical protein [Microbacterium sp.]|uniref:hypothetical protein n=1 Tax=Microbacterium sp. TaxID=51671 RepID=UPI0037C833B0